MLLKPKIYDLTIDLSIGEFFLKALNTDWYDFIVVYHQGKGLRFVIRVLDLDVVCRFKSFVLLVGSLMGT